MEIAAARELVYVQYEMTERHLYVPLKTNSEAVDACDSR